MYISSEFQLGQVYMGETDETERENVLIYRPVYICVPHEKIQVTNTAREGMVSRAGSRISMTRLFDRKSWKMQSSSRDSDREDSSVTDLQARDSLVHDNLDYLNKDAHVFGDSGIIDKQNYLCAPTAINSDSYKKESELSSGDCLKCSDSLESLKLNDTSDRPEQEYTKVVIDRVITNATSNLAEFNDKNDGNDHDVVERAGDDLDKKTDNEVNDIKSNYVSVNINTEPPREHEDVTLHVEDKTSDLTDHHTPQLEIKADDLPSSCNGIKSIDSDIQAEIE